ncbi:MAG: glycosyltransferase [Acidimicrobiia bacterium]|nr:glycosyltransferase [Acidimicrobiia bacterium]
MRAVEGAFIRGAGFVSTVADGIADALVRLYGLPERPLVIRNMPPFQAMPYREPEDRINVLYHGMFLRDRGLGELIDSVPMWPPEYRLLLRGLGKPHYEAELRDRAAGSPARDRIEFPPAAPMSELVTLANESDIGVFFTPGTSGQNRFALPNKIFEYVMAGLALCVSNVIEIRRVMDQYGLGLIVDELTPAAIAGAIRTMDRDRISVFKRAALEAAGSLSWDSEREVLLGAYERLWSPPLSAIS